MTTVCTLGLRGESRAIPRATRRAEATTSGNGVGRRAESTNRDPYCRRGEESDVCVTRGCGGTCPSSSARVIWTGSWMARRPGRRGCLSHPQQINTMVINLIIGIASAKPKAQRKCLTRGTDRIGWASASQQRCLLPMWVGVRAHDAFRNKCGTTCGREALRTSEN